MSIEKVYKGYRIVVYKVPGCWNVETMDGEKIAIKNSYQEATEFIDELTGTREEQADTLYPAPTVQLINYTQNAAHLLAFTKNTRLEMTAESYNDALAARPWGPLKDELKYISQSIRSSWEFVDYVFLIRNVSRAFTHQFVRTRTGSYAQQSLRVVTIADGLVGPRKMKTILPERFRENGEMMDEYGRVMDRIEEGYKELIHLGAATEDARAVLPTNVATNIVAKFNLRTLADLVASRSGGRTQGEYQKVVKLMTDEVLRVHFWADMFLFGDKDRDYFQEIEDFAEEQFGGDLKTKGKLLKIVDRMRGVK